MRRTLARTAPSLPSASYGQPGADKNQGPVAHQTQGSINVANQTQLSRDAYIQGTYIIHKEHLWHIKLNGQGTHTYKEYICTYTHTHTHTHTQGTPVAHQIEPPT